ncbi:hypothetical protein Y1Q_0007329 [Alligator mississippiensis]|uniref:DDE Tnp4 domain-containing protein n=1 Tax=Alligator mississippiensis TaxID=8496 RepID=A0A151P7K5_ALLMI|nr:hypothetical protein Y1Q_0007329 [Alligator mississippiensis]
MTQATFLGLLEQLHLHLELKETNIWQPLPTDTWLAISLLKLATSASLHYVGHLFGMGKATITEAILEVCDTLSDVLGYTMLCVHDLLAVVVGFHDLGFSQCIRALDRTHIPITCPLQRDHPYYSQWCFQSIVLQVITDHCSVFTNMSASWVDSAYNACIFQNSALPALVESECFAP